MTGQKIPTPKTPIKISSSTSSSATSSSFLQANYILHPPPNPKLQLSLTTFPSKTQPPFPPFHPSNPTSFARRPQPQTLTLSPPNAIRDPSTSPPSSSFSYLSSIHLAIEEQEEYRRARPVVLRKSVDVEGFSIEGLSVGGHETCVIIPEFKCAFDFGSCPTRAIHQNFAFITHAHLDHIGSLPMYVAFRGLYNLKPPTVFVPPSIKEDVEKLLEIHRAMSHEELKVDLIPLDVGAWETYELRNQLVVQPFQTNHVIPSEGFIIYSIRKKQRKQYLHLKGKQIEKLKKSGVEITDTVLSPKVAFARDTTTEYMINPCNADALRAKLLITEATFLDDDISIEHAQQHGHAHLFEIIEHAQLIRNKTVLLTHFSSRYTLQDI